MKDKVIQEVWRIKDALSARHNHDVHALARHLRDSAKRSPQQTVDLHAQRAPSTCGGSAQVAESAATYPEK